MKDFDWNRLVEEHDDAPELDDAEWLAALEAFDEDPEQRALALDADPLLLFRQMPEPQVTEADLDAMKASVANLRRASETLGHRSDAAEITTRRRRTPSWPLAAMLALAVSSAVLTGSHLETSRGDSASQLIAGLPAHSVSSPATSLANRPAPWQARAQGTATDFGVSTVRFDGARAAAVLAARELPLIEDTDPGSNLLMQIEDDDLSLVVVLTNDQDV